jgi:hypothetical protein
MALVFSDSFDHYTYGGAKEKWTHIDTDSPYGIVTGRTGKGGRWNAPFLTGFPHGSWKTFPARYPTLTMGAAYQPYAGSNVQEFKFRSTGPAPAGFDFRLNLAFDKKGEFGIETVNESNNLTRVESPAGGVIFPIIMHSGTWYFIEVQATVSGTTTSTVDAVVRINQKQVATCHMTCNNCPAYEKAWDAIALAGIIDDLYVTDGEFKGTPQEFLGDIRIRTLAPNGVGSIEQWINGGSIGSGPNWTSVDDSPYGDDDDSAVYAPTVGLTDMYTLQDLGSAGDIKSVQGLWSVRKSDANPAAIKPQWQSGASVVEGPEFNPTFPGYLYAMQPAEKSLFTGLDWTAAEINALQLGIKRTV